MGWTAFACAPHPYGYARTYEPLKAEEDLYEKAQSPPYEEVLRDPVRYGQEPIGWFAVVESVGSTDGGKTQLVLGRRIHQARHLCAERSESSCRVTVSERSTGRFRVALALRPEDRQGKDRVWEGSLLRVYGTTEAEYDEDGQPILDVQYYRHWPHGTYVTTAARSSMRR